MDVYHSIYIDIFPYDNLPDGKVERETFLRKSKKLYQFNVYRTILHRDKPRMKGIKWMVMAGVRRILHYLLNLFNYCIVKKLMNYITQLFKKWDVYLSVYVVRFQDEIYIL